MSDLSGKTVLITGTSGFIGKHLLNRMRQVPDIALIVVSRTPVAEQRKKEIWIGSALEDLAESVWREHGINQIHTVFHLGAYTPKNSASADEVDAIYRSNLIGTRRLVESLPSQPEAIVFSSTLDVYSPPEDGECLTETSPLHPPTLYGASKLFGEHLIEAYARKTGCRYAILRYGHIYGPGEEAYAKLIPVAIRSLLQGKAPVIYGNGSVLRDFFYVEDAVEATVRAASLPQNGCGPINIVSGDSHPVSEIIQILVRLSGFSGDIQYLREKPGGRSLRFSNRKMRELLGEWNTVPLEEGLRRELEYARNIMERESAASR